MSGHEQPLGSLAQASRAKELKTARWILIVIGVLITLIQSFMFSNAAAEVEALDAEFQRQGMYIPDKEAVVRATKVIYAITIGVGIALVACGLAVYRAPVVATITGLVIYIGNIAAGVALAEGEDKIRALFGGIIIKVIVIVCLVKAVQAAVAFQKEARAAKMMSGQPPAFQ